MRMAPRGSPGTRQAGTGAGSSRRYVPSFTRRPMSVAMTVFPMDQLSSCVSLSIPGA